MLDRQNPEKKDSIIPRLINPFLSFHTQNQTGTTLVTGVALGLIALGGATLAIAKAGQNKTNTIADENTKQVLSVTEGGINNLIAQLSTPKGRPLLLLNNDPNGLLQCTSNCDQWSSEVANTVIQSYNVTPANACSSASISSETTIIPNDRSQSLRASQNIGSGASAGDFQLLAYRYVPNDSSNPTGGGIGRMLVQGNLSQTGKDNNKARFEVRFPVTIQPASGGGAGGAALMGNKIDLKKTDVKADSVVCTNPALCAITCSSGATNPTDAQLKTAIGAESNAVITGLTTANATLKVGGSVIPPIPAVPAVATINNLNNITSTVKLPRTVGDGSGVTVNDVPHVVNGVTTYYYQIADWTSNSSVLIKNGQTAQFRVYVSGNINYSGNNGIGIETVGTGNPPPIAPTPGQIRLFGGFANGNPPSTTQTWNFGGTFCQTAFLHAPNSNVTFNGGGAGCSGMTVPNPTGTGTITFPSNNAPNFYGAVWVNQFLAGSTNSTYFYEQPGIMTVLTSSYGAGAFSPQSVVMNSISQFERRGL
ncbi:hypothetical protein ACN4EE_15245 [Geminocystis sp. CENA526]|uniref:hypothetical protein n=1 Tax=Geminocystis sp. CENA526 TaxID=1355871 RepID=UPI003D6FDCAA